MVFLGFSGDSPKAVPHGGQVGESAGLVNPWPGRVPWRSTKMENLKKCLVNSGELWLI